MLPEIREIKIRRKALGLTQIELANLAGISQSLIAKTESLKIVPSYEKVKTLFDALEELAQEEEVKAKDLMSKNIIYVKENDCIKKALGLMNKNSVSQLPVIKKGQSVGLVSDKILLEEMNSKKVNINRDIIKEIMNDSLPVVGEETPKKLLSKLLEHNAAVLVAKKGRIRGIIAKSDLLNAMV